MNSEASSIGIIGGADGPTTIFVETSHAEVQWWRKTLEQCKSTVRPRETRVTGDELVQHLMDVYGAYEVPVSQGKRLALKMSVLLNHHSGALAQPPMPPQDADRETWQAWAKQAHVSMEAVRAIPDEQYGLRYMFLAIPRTEKTERFYAEAEREQASPRRSFWQRLLRRKPEPVRVNKMVFGIELSTGYWQLDDGCGSLVNEVIRWRGVTRADIDNETPEFMAYAMMMRDTGLLEAK